MTVGIESAIKGSRSVEIPKEWAALDRKLWSSAAFLRALLSLDINRVKLVVMDHYIDGAVAPLMMDYLIQNYELDWKDVPCDLLIQSQLQTLTSRYVAPRLDFEYASMREFIMIDEYLQEYISALDHNGSKRLPSFWIHRLVSVMIRKSYFSHMDGREAIDLQKIHNNTMILERYSSGIITRKTIMQLSAASLLYAIGLKERVHQLYAKWLFSSSASADTSALNLGWQGIAMQVAESGVFGNYESVLDSQFHDVCAWLVLKKQEHDKMESEMNRHK